MSQMFSRTGIAALALVAWSAVALPASAADLVAPPPVPAAPIPAAPVYRLAVFTGFDGRAENGYGYLGFLYALNGNLAADGFVVRGLGLFNKYSYSSTAVPWGRVYADAGMADLMVGYQKALPGVIARLMVGLDYEGHNLHPYNPFDWNAGSHVGAKVLGSIETAYGAPFYAHLQASYGTARQRYWARGRVGYNFGGLILGPEGLVTGNRVSNEQRVGGFATVRLPSLAPLELSLSAGLSKTQKTRTGTSAYGTVEVSTAF